MKLKSFTNKDRHGNMTSFEFYEGSDFDMGPIPPMMEGVPDHPGDPKGTDTVPAWLTPGEFVMNAEATRMFEPQIEQMNNAGRAMQAQQGGTIPEYAAHGGPVYMNQGGSWLDSLLGLFSGSSNEPVDTSNVVSANSPLRNLTNSQLVNKVQNQINPPGPTRPDPLMSNKIYMDLLKDKEGFRNEAYLDSAGVPTIGYGFTKGVKMGDTMTEEEANARLLEEMAITDRDYNNLVTADLNSNQQAAVKSLIYNIGGPQFANSKARAALNAGDFETFKKEAAEFRMADGKVVPGLENRRRDEIELFNTPPRTAKEIFDERVPALQGKVNERNLSIPDELSGPEMGRKQTSQEIFDSRVPALQSRVNDRTAAEEFSGTGIAPRTAKEIFDERIPALRDKIDERNLSIPDELSGPEMGRGRTAQEIFNERIPALQSKVAEGNLSIPDELSGPEMGRRRTPQEVFDNRVPVLHNMANPEADEMLQASEFEGLGGVPPMDDAPIDFSQYSDGPFGPRVPDAIGPRSEDQQIRDEVLLGKTDDTQKTDKGNTSLNQGEYGTHNTIIREDAYGNPITYKWDESKNAYVDSEGLKYNRSFGERVSSLLPKQTIENAEPEPGDTQIGTLNGSPVYMGQDGNPYVMEDLNVLGTAVGVQKMKLQPWQTDNIKLLPKENRPVAGPKTPSPKDKDGLIDLPVDISMSDELSGTPMDSSAGVPKLEEAPPKAETDTTKPPLDLEGGVAQGMDVLDEIINDDENLKDDKTVPKGTTAEDALAAGSGASDEDVNKAKGFFQSILGDLFDEGELQRMAIMYVGGRMLGGSHNGSLNFAAKQYVQRVDQKVADKKAEKKALEKEERVRLREDRKSFNKHIQQMNAAGKRSAASIEAYRKSYDPKTGLADASLLKDVVKPSAINMNEPPKYMYHKDTNQKVLVRKLKVGDSKTGSETKYVYATNGPKDKKTNKPMWEAGEVIDSWNYHEDKALVPGEKENEEYRKKIAGEVKIHLDKLITLHTVKGEDGKDDYRHTDVESIEQAEKVAKYMMDNKVPPLMQATLTRMAFESMIADGIERSKGLKTPVKHREITKFMDGAYISVVTSTDLGDVFNVPGTGKPGDLREISNLTNDLVRQAKADENINTINEDGSQKKDHEIAKHIYKDLHNAFLKGEYSVPDPDPSNPNKTKVIKLDWLDGEMRAKFIEAAKERNTSPFQLFIEQFKKQQNMQPPTQ